MNQFNMKEKLIKIWQLIRQLSGDDAYEKYLKHFYAHHTDDEALPLTRTEFFKQWQDKKWTGVKRCC
jgi:uncharacterized short protein YbdD (DUF466 family)